MDMNDRKMKRVVVSIYIDPDYYPPTINAINNLAAYFEEVIVITRNNSRDDFPFPPNVRLIKLGKFATVRETEKFSFIKKGLDFLKFTWQFWKYSVSSKTSLVVMYDPIPLLAYYIARPFMLAGRKAWYHNHDMPSVHRLRKYSIGWFAATYESRAMKMISMFSLPSEDRLLYYPSFDRAIPYATIPNYPSTKVYLLPTDKPTDETDIRIIYQGFIGKGHALEELIAILQDRIDGKKLHLILKGSVNEAYKQSLQSLAEKYAVTDQLTWIGIGPYAGLPALTRSCHIGIGVHMNTDEVSKTLGTASNKIYEYAASGLPVLLYDNEQFRKYLSGYSWTYFTDGTVGDIRLQLGRMIAERTQTAIAARKDFEAGLNFEKAFEPAWAKMKSLISH